MRTEKIEQFKNICDYAKKQGINVSTIEFQSYVAVMNAIQYYGEDNVYSEEDIARLTDRVNDIYLDTDEDSMCSLESIANYCIENEEDIDNMTNREIIEDILC